MNVSASPNFDPCAVLNTKSAPESALIIRITQWFSNYVKVRSEQRVLAVMMSDPRVARDLRIARDRHEWREPNC